MPNKDIIGFIIIVVLVLLKEIMDKEGSEGIKEWEDKDGVIVHRSPGSPELSKGQKERMRPAQDGSWELSLQSKMVWDTGRKNGERVKEFNGRNKKKMAKGLFQMCVDSRRKQGSQEVERNGELRECWMRNTRTPKDTLRMKRSRRGKSVLRHW